MPSLFANLNRTASLRGFRLPTFAKTSHTGQSPERFAVCEDDDYYFQKHSDDIEGEGVGLERKTWRPETGNTESEFSDTTFSEGETRTFNESAYFQKRSVRSKGYRGCTLHDAAAEADLERLQSLLDNGALLDAQDDEDWTPLHHAAHAGHDFIAETLLEKGAAPDPVTLEGDTPLHKAVVGNHAKVIEVLAAAGADVNAQNESGWAPIHEATVNGHLEIVELLLQLGADIGIRTFEGDTPLHKAVRWGHADVVRKLLAVGADMAAIDLLGRRPVDRTVDPDMINILGGFPRRHTRSSSDNDSWRSSTEQESGSSETPDNWHCPAGPAEAAWDSIAAREDYELRWALFATATGDEGSVSYQHIPWPTRVESNEAVLDVVLSGVTDALEIKKRLRSELLRWHPDKFEAAFGRRIAPEEKDRIMARVKEISQTLTSY